MNCIILFTIDGEDIEMQLPISEKRFNNGELLQVISEQLNVNLEIKNDISSKLKNKISGTKITKESLKTPFVPNHDLNSLKARFPNTRFATSGNYKVLVTDSLLYYGHDLTGKIVDGVFIINPRMINRFGDYTLIMEALESMNLSEDEFIDDITKRLVPKGSTVINYLKDFMLNNDKYIKSLSQSDYNNITSYLRSLIGRKYGINKELSEIGNKIKIEAFNEDKGVISVRKLKKILQEISDEISNKIKTGNITDRELTSLLYKYFLKDADMHIDEVTNKYIVVRPNYKSLADAIGFDTVIAARPTTMVYKGYSIYEFEINGKLKYLPSEHFLSLRTSEKALCDSISLAYEYIDKYEGNRHLYDFSSIDNSKLGIQEVELSLYYSPKEVVKVLTYFREGPTLSKTAIKKHTMTSFREEMKMRYPKEIAEQIVSQIDNPQYAYFLLKHTPSHLNAISEEEKSKNGQEALEIMNDIIENAETEYYTIINSSKNKYSYTTRLTRISENDLERITNSGLSLPQGSIDVYFEAIKSSFSNLGLHIEIINDPNATFKAYLKNGIIYLNKAKASYHDALHEYTHLFLQMVKALNPELYSLLIYDFSEFISENKFNKAKELYSDLSDEEIYEEILCDEYALYLKTGTKTEQLLKVFNEASKSIEYTTGVPSLIWDNSGNMKLNDFLNTFFGFVNESIKDVGLIVPTLYRSVAEDFIETQIQEVSKPEDTDFLSKICK